MDTPGLREIGVLDMEDGIDEIWKTELMKLFMGNLLSAPRRKLMGERNNDTDC